MKYKCNKKPLPRSTKERIPLTIVSAVLFVALSAGLYLGFAWHRYQSMAKMEAVHLAQSVGSLLHAEHIVALSNNAQVQEDLLVEEEALARLVEVTDSIYYAYVLVQKGGDITIIADSSATPTTHPTEKSCNHVAVDPELFKTGQGIVTERFSSPCGEWINALVPIYGTDHKNILAVLGLSYSSAEWHANVWRKMVPDILVVACLAALALTLFDLTRKNGKFKEAQKSRQESERSKSVFLSHIPGMAYRCKNDLDWTMEFVSEGCYELTGYKAETFTAQEGRLFFNDIISCEHRDLVRAKWDRVLLQHKRYRGEYEIITKSGERKWVLELGQGVYDAQGRVEALEGIVLDISEPKKKDLQIAHLRDHDFLTGLYNRNYMEEKRHQLDQAEFWPLSVAICDIDGLRVINDAYGHEVGDELIIHTAQLLQSCLRDHYVLGHTGSGEFMLLLPNTDKQSADLLIIDIENTIHNFNRVNGHAPYTISVSVGLSTKQSKDQEMQMVMTEADENMRRRKMLNQYSSHSAIVSSIMATMYAKSQETEEHGQRLGTFCLMIGAELDLLQADLDDLQLLSKLHDIGKIGIEDHILNKPGKLDEKEWEIMKKHPEIGYRIAMTTPQFKHIAQYILNHHERWDGAGYPKGLKGKEIPLIARILSVADAFDAMTEDRVYRKALTEKEALKEIECNSGSQFDPQIAMLFVRILREKCAI